MPALPVNFRRGLLYEFLHYIIGNIFYFTIRMKKILKNIQNQDIIGICAEKRSETSAGSTQKTSCV